MVVCISVISLSEQRDGALRRYATGAALHAHAHRRPTPTSQPLPLLSGGNLVGCGRILAFVFDITISSGTHSAYTPPNHHDY